MTGEALEIFRMLMRSPLEKGHMQSREEITYPSISWHCMILPVTSFLCFSLKYSQNSDFISTFCNKELVHLLPFSILSEFRLCVKFINVKYFFRAGFYIMYFAHCCTQVIFHNNLPTTLTPDPSARIPLNKAP